LAQSTPCRDGLPSTCTSRRRRSPHAISPSPEDGRAPRAVHRRPGSDRVPGRVPDSIRPREKQLLDLALGLLLQGKHPSSSVLRGCRRAPSSICASPKDLTGAVHEGTGAAPLQLRRPLKGTGALAHWRNGTWTAPIAPVVRQLKNADWRSVYSSFQSPGMT